MGEEIPTFVTHYHLADKPPFLNLSDLDEAELAAAMQDLERRRASSGLKRVFGARYMQLRRLTEGRLYELFLQAGGMPERKAPHYLVLGSSEWYRGLAPDTCEVVLPLADLPTEVTSFTYPDSFTAMAFGPQFGKRVRIMSGSSGSLNSRMSSPSMGCPPTEPRTVTRGMRIDRSRSISRSRYGPTSRSDLF